MAEFLTADRRYTYIHECKDEAVDLHHILVRKSKANSLTLWLAAITLLANALCLCSVKDLSASILFCSFLSSAIVIKSMFWKPIVKESVIIMPSFGVQLETHYTSGRIDRQFVPTDKILKPVLVECVNSVTCYWSLSLILRDQADLMLVFKIIQKNIGIISLLLIKEKSNIQELRPPVKMLTPIWKALCVASGSEEHLTTFAKSIQ